MWRKQIFLSVLTLATAGLILLFQVSPGSAQTSFRDLSPYNLLNNNLQFYRDYDDATAPVVVDGRGLFSIGQIGSKPAEERVSSIEEELLDAIRSDNFAEVAIEEQGGLPVLYLVYDQSTEAELQEGLTIPQDRRYLFTVTQEDTIGRKSKRETAVDFKREIERAIARAKMERSSAYIQRQGLIAAGLLLLGLLGSRLFSQLQTYPLRRAIQRIIPGLPSNTGAQPSSLTTIFRLKLGFAQFILWTVIVISILRLFPGTRQQLYFIFSIIISTFDKSIFNVGGTEFSLIRLAILIGLFVASIFLSTYITNLLRTNVLQVTRMTRGSQEIISIITKYGLIAFSTIVLLQVNGINLSSLALIGSALGVGIGFGFQDIARNFASGIVLLFERSIQVGDFIQVGDHLGVVEEVRTRSIVMKTLDRISIIVPNSRLLSDEVINWNHRRSVSRLHLPIGVAYSSDVKKVKAALLQAAAEHLEVLRNPAPQVFFMEFGESSFNFELLVWTSDPSRQAPLKSDLYFRIEEIFHEQQIDIPFPQRDVNLKTESMPIELSPQLEGHLLYLLKGLISQQQDSNVTSHTSVKPSSRNPQKKSARDRNLEK